MLVHCECASSPQLDPLSITLDNTGTERGEAVVHSAQRALVDFVRTRTSSPGKLVVEKFSFCCRRKVSYNKKLTTKQTNKKTTTNNQKNPPPNKKKKKKPQQTTKKTHPQTKKKKKNHNKQPKKPTPKQKKKTTPKPQESRRVCDLHVKPLYEICLAKVSF
ncbi:hypothetical protein llap_9452 [Limosa lapponica baueri]|uniref:Uncharacterized protein n=1 Tax=Limosa lapponica baueri TaxID=1758121 RepID=A0A2I0U2G6_LIMLA|nr:hypothetical protein llap_9452 [Limosa lapponica baueri]